MVIRVASRAMPRFGVPCRPLDLRPGWGGLQMPIGLPELSMMLGRPGSAPPREFCCPEDFFR